MSSRFILGTVQFGLDYGINNASGKPSKDSVFEILELAYASGIQELDSADAYGNAQELLGEFMKTTGKEFLINSKFHIHGETAIRDQLTKTLEQLQIKKLNVYFFHRFEDAEKAPESFEELKSLKKENRISKIGVSVYTNEELESCIANKDIDVIQLPFNLLDNYSRRGTLINRAKKMGKELQVRSVFLQGLFFRDTEGFPETLKPLTKYISRLNDIAVHGNLSMYDLALNYVLSKSEIDKVIIGVDSKEQLQNNLAISKKAMNEALAGEVDKVNVKEEALLYPYNWK